jgi:hypothetical protein
MGQKESKQCISYFTLRNNYETLVPTQVHLPDFESMDNEIRIFYTPIKHGRNVQVGHKVMIRVDNKLFERHMRSSSISKEDNALMTHISFEMEDIEPTRNDEISIILDAGSKFDGSWDGKIFYKGITNMEVTYKYGRKDGVKSPVPGDTSN